MKEISQRKVIQTTGLAICGVFLFKNDIWANKADNMNITPFIVSIDNNSIEELKSRIGNVRWPNTITNSEWQLGTDLAFLKDLCDYWRTAYSWRETEKLINSYPNFIARIDGIDIHFIHVKGKGKKNLPLIITHGWPGSFLEMLKIIPLLTDDPEFSFDIVVPSVPGFGFSGKPEKFGCNSHLVAGLWQKLMAALGYARYCVQGGDIGAGVGTWLALLYPDQVLGLHLNFIPGSYRPYISPGEKLLPEEEEFRQRVNSWSVAEGAYGAIQSTKPQTLSYALNDSPVGLCAWLSEKFYNWSDHERALDEVISKDELLGNISLYWFTQTLPSSARIYWENSRKPLTFGKDDRIKIPVAFARFPKELPTPPRTYIERGYNIRQWTEMPAGGHFAALEQPKLLAADVQKFFRSI